MLDYREWACGRAGRRLVSGWALGACAVCVPHGRMPVGLSIRLPKQPVPPTPFQMTIFACTSRARSVTLVLAEGGLLGCACLAPNAPSVHCYLHTVGSFARRKHSFGGTCCPACQRKYRLGAWGQGNWRVMAGLPGVAWQLQDMPETTRPERCCCCCYVPCAVYRVLSLDAHCLKCRALHGGRVMDARGNPLRARWYAVVAVHVDANAIVPGTHGCIGLHRCRWMGEGGAGRDAGVA